jgi:hypothetical protein
MSATKNSTDDYTTYTSENTDTGYFSYMIGDDVIDDSLVKIKSSKIRQSDNRFDI